MRRLGPRGLGLLGVSSKYGPLDPPEKLRLLRIVVDGRPDFVDTASVYGEDDGRVNPLLGRVLAESAADVPIVSKVASGMVDGARAVEDYRRALGELGRSDVVLTHRAGEECLERDRELHDAVRADGRRFGICTNDRRVLELYAGAMRIDVLQVALNLLDARAALPILEAARTRGIYVMARSALSSGLLGGSYGPGDVDRFTDDLRRRFRESERSRAIYAERMAKAGRVRAYWEALRASGRYGGSLAAFCYAAVGRLPGVDAVLLGGRTEAQLRENLRWTAAELPGDVAGEIAARKIEDWAAPYL